MRLLLTSAALLLSPVFSFAQPFTMEPGPLSPQDSLKCIKTRPGFKVELMVSEPLVLDPIAFAWGPDGKFWVVEMGDYPLGVPSPGMSAAIPGGKPGGKIKYLEKTRPDGPYDKMTLFMDGLNFPTGVFPYKNGVLVTAAPDIFYAEKGKDGKIKKEVLFTGFKEGNQQHRVNGLTWGIDNWIYGANGDSGGVIKSLKTGKTVDIRGRDFRFKPETGEFEAQSGQSQFGRCRDDWGNWFGNNNSNPMFHYVLDDHYLKRNPHVLYPDPRVPVIPGAIRVYPISKPLPRFNTPGALNHFTSACSTIIYRDTLFGPEFEGNAFVSEPVHNLIHRAIVKPKGVTFTAERAKDEQTSEFLASSDNWFRPAMIQVGPDGALWIADMYRYVIEHPEWIPKDWQKKLDLRAGHDKGRIYRVYPEQDQAARPGGFRKKTPNPIAAMDTLNVKQLVAALSSPSGWTRDMAHQILVSPAMKDQKNAIVKECNRLPKRVSPQALIHVLHILHYYEELTRIDLFLEAPHPMVRKHAIALFEEVGQPRAGLPFERLGKDADPAVRMQLAYSIGRIQRRDPRYSFLARILCDCAEDRYLLAAALSSITKETWEPLFAELMKEERIPVPLFTPFMGLAGAYDKPYDVSRLFVRQLVRHAEHPPLSGAEEFRQIGDLLDSMEKNNVSLQRMLKNLTGAEVETTKQQLEKIHAKAQLTFESPTAETSQKTMALRLLGRGLGDDRKDHKRLTAALTPLSSDEMQAAVVQHLGHLSDPRVPGMLIEPWKSYSPSLRGKVLDALLGRPEWTKSLLMYVKRNDIPAQEIDAVRRQRLLTHKDPDIRAAAKEIFAAASSPDRGKLVALYQVQLPEKTDAAHGAKLFAKSCAACHKLGDIGQNVGPDFAAIGDKSVQGLLIAILDPNRAVETRYISYVATTRKGLVFNGILTSETSTSITLTGPDGKQHQLLRNELDELSSTGKSLMPEGFEKDLTARDVADIIAFIREQLPMPKRKMLPGNVPETVLPDKAGRLHLRPSNGAIYGPSLVVEKQHGNLGYWTKPEDHVVWTVEVKKDATYSVWLDYAMAPDSAGNTLSIQSGDQKLTHVVKSTGSWDAYQLQSIGALKLSAGRHEIVVRAEGPIRGALIDLKEIELRPR